MGPRGKPGVDGWIQVMIYLEVYLNKAQIMENLHVGTLKITISIHASYASIQFHTMFFVNIHVSCLMSELWLHVFYNWMLPCICSVTPLGFMAPQLSSNKQQEITT